jgi:outer membrane biosynthesis protein TonB
MPGKLLLGAGIALAATVTTVAVAHSAPARSAARFVVPPGETAAPTGSPQSTVGEAPQPDPARSEPPVPVRAPEPAPTDRPAVVQTPKPNADPGVHLDDGLSESDPGQPKQPSYSQDPNSNG